MPIDTTVTTARNRTNRFRYDHGPLIHAMHQRKLDGLPSGLKWAAGQSGLSIATVSRALNGKGTPQAIGKLCRVLGVARRRLQIAEALA